MYSGIVSGIFIVNKIKDIPGRRTFYIDLDDRHLAELFIGSSVSLDGVCLTVVSIVSSKVSFDLSQETINQTTLGSVKVGDKVNIERSIKSGQEIGGHPISGHIDTTAKVIEVDSKNNNWVVTFSVSPNWLPYLFRKGFIAINGASLTIAEIDKKTAQFSVSIIPETLRQTTFKEKQKGALVNLEIDRQIQILVDTIKNTLSEIKL